MWDSISRRKREKPPKLINEGKKLASKYFNSLELSRECESENVWRGEYFLQTAIDFFWCFSFYRLTRSSKQKTKTKMCTHSKREKSFWFFHTFFSFHLSGYKYTFIFCFSLTLSCDLFPSRMKVLFPLALAMWMFQRKNLYIIH